MWFGSSRAPLRSNVGHHSWRSLGQSSGLTLLWPKGISHTCPLPSSALSSYSKDASFKRVMLSIFQASTFPGVGRLCRTIAPLTVAIWPAATPTACPRLTKRYLQTGRFDTTRIWNRCKVGTSPNRNGVFTRGHQLPSASTSHEPRAAQFHFIHTNVYILGLIASILAGIIREAVFGDTWLVLNALVTFEPGTHPPELVRICMQIKSLWKVCRACICHLDGLLTVGFAECGRLESPVVPRRMSM